jgi:HPt (histidine-containing phosphotransfer) domain-containing protein
MEISIDISYLESMTGGDKQLMKEMIDIFKEQVPEFVGEMKKCLSVSDYKGLAAIAHKAKSSISIFGLVQLISDLKKFEIKVANCEKTETYNEFIHYFETTCNQAIFQINKMNLY